MLGACRSIGVFKIIRKSKLPRAQCDFFLPFQTSIVTVLGSRPASAAGVFKFFKMTATKHSAILEL